VEIKFIEGLLVRLLVVVIAVAGLGALALVVRELELGL